jgi:hypothetical protein
LLQQLGEVADDDVGAVLEELVRLAHAIDADNQPKPAGAAGRNTGEGVLEHSRLLRGDLQRPSRGEEGVRRRLSVEVLLRRDDAVDANLEQVIDSGCRENPRRRSRSM